MLSNRVRSHSLLLAASTSVLSVTLITCVDSSVAPPEAESASVVTEAVSHAPTFTTAFKAPLVVEGLIADHDGNLYAAGRGGASPCPVWRVPARGGAAVVVGSLPAPCSPSGLTFDRRGELFVTDGADKIYRLRPAAAAPPVATLFASGVAGANGVAFDRAGNLWATDGGTAQGRVYRIGRDGVVTEAFRIPPLANLVNAVAPPGGGEGVVQGGVGRDVRALPPGSITVTASGRAAADTLGSVAIVANGIAFSSNGRSVFVADTARGAIWKAELDHRGNLQSAVGCDTTFTPNTLCLDNVFVQHPALDGLDGIALDRLGNLWGVANERNSVVLVTASARVREVFRNAPDPTTRLRNIGPLEFPTSPALVDGKLCVTQSDTSRRDNVPNTGGEVGPASPERAKISCTGARVSLGGLD